jgi:hypothetical protein
MARFLFVLILAVFSPTAAVAGDDASQKFEAALKRDEERAEAAKNAFKKKDWPLVQPVIDGKLSMISACYLHECLEDELAAQRALKCEETKEEIDKNRYRPGKTIYHPGALYIEDPLFYVALPKDMYNDTADPKQCRAAWNIRRYQKMATNWKRSRHPRIDIESVECLPSNGTCGSRISIPGPKGSVSGKLVSFEKRRDQVMGPGWDEVFYSDPETIKIVVRNDD